MASGCTRHLVRAQSDVGRCIACLQRTLLLHSLGQAPKRSVPGAGLLHGAGRWPASQGDGVVRENGQSWQDLRRQEVHPRDKQAVCLQASAASLFLLFRPWEEDLHRQFVQEAK